MTFNQVVPGSNPGTLIDAQIAQLVEQRTENPRVVGSIPTEGTMCGFSSSGRAPPCQGGGSEFEPRHSLQKGRHDLWSCLPFWVPAALRPAPFGIPMLGRSKFALRRPAEQVPGAFAESMISVFHPVLKKERGKYSVFSFCQSNKLELLFSL